MPFPYKTPQEALAGDQFHDLDMHSPWLIEVAKGNIFEIGVREGTSTASFLLGLEKNGGHLWSLDINPGCGASFTGNEFWTFLAGDSKNLAWVKERIPAALDILFIDGDHTYEGAKSDLENYGPLVKSGGRIILHDVCSGYDLGVRQAFDEYVAKTGYAFEIFKSWVGLGQILIP